MGRRIRYTPQLLVALLTGALSCNDLPTAVPPPAPEPPPAGRRVLGVVAMHLSVVGPGEVRTSTSFFQPGISGPDGPRFTLSKPPDQGDVRGLIFDMLPGAGSFTHGTPAGGGYRYVFAAAKVRNAGIKFTGGVPGDTVAYTTARQNVTLIAIEIPAGSGADGIAGTPFADLQKFDGSDADPAIAAGIRPTGAVKQTLTGGITTHSPDVLQVFPENEVAPIVAIFGFDPFPYGFVIKHATATTDRTLAANPGPTQYDGIITLGLKIPLQTNPANDVYGFSMFFVLVEDSETRVTQSLEEQDAAGQTAFEARVAQLSGLSGVTILPGGSYGGSVSAPVRKLCAVRVAGTVASPTAFLDGSTAASCPTLTSVSPNSGVQGNTVSVTFTGTNFVIGSGNTTVAISGSGVAVQNVNVANTTSLTADFVIGAGATTGARTVTVTTATGNSNTRTFTVNAPPPPAPTLTGLSPNSVAQGSGAPVTLTGTNFVSGASIAVSGSGVSVFNPTFVNGTTMTADFVVDAGAAPGARNVTVTTAGGTSGAQTFTVNPPPGSQTFDFTGSGQSFTVPAGVTSITINAFGAQGGQGYNNLAGNGVGANGGRVGATISVTPGEVLAIFVGGQGGAAANGVAGAAGLNGGAAGGSQSDAGGGGGGASDVRRGGIALADRIAVAGGGGGGGGSGNGGNGGLGGGSTAGAGGDAGGGTATGGGGGTATTGGAAGTGNANSGTAGSQGNGGAGGTGAMSAGGGGGGYYGGGGGGGANSPLGGGAGGGGGGSSFTTTGATNVTHNQGVKSGHGQVAISW